MPRQHVLDFYEHVDSPACIGCVNAEENDAPLEETSPDDGYTARREEEAQAAESPSAEPEPDGWVEVELLDEDGQPVANMTCELTDADGTIHRLTTDAQGIARQVGLPTSQVQVGFPDLDDSAWETA